MKKAILGLITIIIIAYSCHPTPQPEDMTPQAPDFTALTPEFPSFFDASIADTNSISSKDSDENFLLAQKS